MPHSFYYLRGALGDADLLDAHKEAINQLLTGDYTQKNIEKLQGHDVYSLRIGHQNAGRLLFTTTAVSGQNYLLVLEYLPTHDYKKSHFLRSGVLRHYVARQADAHADLVSGAAAEEAVFVFEEAGTMSDIGIAPGASEAVPSTVLDYYQGAMIALSLSQDEALNLTLPAVISGVAGSGKSCIALSLLSSFVLKPRDAMASEERPLRVLYVTEKRHLVVEIKKAWDALPVAQDESCTVDILAYQDLMQQRTGNAITWESEDRFKRWYDIYTKRHQNKQVKAFSQNAMYQEFRICSGYIKADYLILGKRQSSLAQDQEMRAAFYDDYTAYRQDFEGGATSHHAPASALEAAPYDFIVVDEAQDFSYEALHYLHALARNHAISYCMDSHQSLHDALSARPYLLATFNASHTTLETTYRCPAHVVLAANQIIGLKNRLTGGLADKLESRRIEAVDETKAPGEVYLVDEASLRGGEWLAAEKGADFAVVADAEKHDAARAYFNTALVFTPEAIKGLEFKVVVAYQLFDAAIFKRANAQLSLLEKSAEEKKHRAKSGAGDSQFGPAFNRVYTAYTRAQQVLIIFEKSTRETKHLLDGLHLTPSDGDVLSLEKASEKSTPEDWMKVIKRLLQVGNEPLAKSLFEAHIPGPVNFDGFVASLSAPAPKLQAPVAAMSGFGSGGGGGFGSGGGGSCGGGFEPIPATEQQSRVSPSTKKKSPTTSPTAASESSKKSIREYARMLQLGFSRETLREALKHYELAKLLSENLKLDAGKKAKKDNKNLITSIKQSESKINLFCECLEEKGIIKSISTGDMNTLLNKLKNGRGNPNALILAQRMERLIRVHMKDEAFTNLFMAARDGHAGMVKAWLDDGRANPNQEVKERETPLFIASQNGHAEVVVALLRDERVDPNQALANGTAPLFIAAQLGQHKVVKVLLADKRTDPNQAVANGATPLFIAVQNGHIEALQAFLDDGRADPNQLVRDGSTPLFIAAQTGQIEVLRELLRLDDKDRRVDPNQTRADGLTPLHVAVAKGFTEPVKALLDDKRTDPNQATKYGETPLFIAAKMGQVEMVKALMQLDDVEPNQPAEGNVTPLHIAAQNGYAEVVKALLADKRTKPNQANNLGETPLFIAAKNRNTEVVRTLLADKCIDPNQAAKGGVTPLFIMAYNGSIEIVMALLADERTDPNQAEANGATPLLIATQNGHTEIVEALRQHEPRKAAPVARPFFSVAQGAGAAADEEASKGTPAPSARK